MVLLLQQQGGKPENRSSIQSALKASSKSSANNGGKPKHKSNENSVNQVSTYYVYFKTNGLLFYSFQRVKEKQSIKAMRTLKAMRTVRIKLCFL